MSEKVKFRSLEQLRCEIEKLEKEFEELQHLRDKCEEFKLLRELRKHIIVESKFD